MTPRIKAISSTYASSSESSARTAAARAGGKPRRDATPGPARDRASSRLPNGARAFPNAGLASGRFPNGRVSEIQDFVCAATVTPAVSRGWVDARRRVFLNFRGHPPDGAAVRAVGAAEERPASGERRPFLETQDFGCARARAPAAPRGRRAAYRRRLLNFRKHPPRTCCWCGCGLLPHRRRASYATPSGFFTASAAAPRMPALLRIFAGTIGVLSFSRGRNWSWLFDTPPPTMNRSGVKRASTTE